MIDRLLALAFWGVLAVGGLLFAAVAWRTAAYPHEVVVSEGAVGMGARSLLDGTPPYAQARFDREPFVVLHYTPLYYVIVAPVMAATGWTFAAGRLVSIVFVLATAAAAGALAFELVRTRTAALAAALIWLSFYQVVFWGTVQRVDAPGIFFEAAGLLLAIRARAAGRTPWTALLCFVLAWSTKQVMVVGLVAVCADLLVRSRRSGVAYTVAAGASLAALAGLLQATSGGAFWRAAVQGTVSADADPPWVIFGNAELFFGSPWNMLLFALAAAGAWMLRDRLLAIYLGFGLVFAIATDANFPRFFPPMLAMAVLAAALIERTERAGSIRRALLGSLVFFAGAHLLYEMRSLVRERIVSLRPGNARLALAQGIAKLTPDGGRVLAQDLGMVLSAGRTPAIADPLVMSILAGNGAWEPGGIAAGIRERRYEAIVLNRPLESIDDVEWTTLWIAPARAEIARRYALAEVLHCDEAWRFLEPDRYVYLPRRGGIE